MHFESEASVACSHQYTCLMHFNSLAKLIKLKDPKIKAIYVSQNFL